MPTVFVKDILASINEYREYRECECENENESSYIDDNNTRTIDVLF